MLLAAAGPPLPGLAQPAAAPGPPGIPAPLRVVAELQAALAQAVRRFEAKDPVGVLAHVSDHYRTGPLTKPAIEAQLLAIFAIHEAVRARVRLDEVRLVGEHAWITSTGDVAGRLPFIGQWVVLYAWERDLEVARREGGTWRLYGYQQ